MEILSSLALEMQKESDEKVAQRPAAPGKDTVSARKQHCSFDHLSHDAPYRPHVNWKQR